jgi:hypothetical protein
MTGDALRLADSLTDAIPSALRYHRALTPLEALHGDVARVEADFDAAEVLVASKAGPVVGKMRKQLAEEARVLVKKRDLAAVASLSASYVGELSTALYEAALRGLAMGRKQIADRRGALKLAEALNLAETDARLLAAQAVLQGRAAIAAAKVAEQTQAAVRTAAQNAIVSGAEDFADEQLTVADAVSDSSLVSLAIAIGRAAIGAGRDVGVGEMKDEGLAVRITRSSVLDDNTCDVCSDADGEVYSENPDDDPDGGVDDLTLPDPDCEGAAYGHECRCIGVVEAASSYDDLGSAGAISQTGADWAAEGGGE